MDLAFYSGKHNLINVRHLLAVFQPVGVRVKPSAIVQALCLICSYDRKNEMSKPQIRSMHIFKNIIGSMTAIPSVCVTEICVLHSF